MTNQTINEAVEELSKDWLFAGDEPKEDDFGIHKEFKDFLREALQAQRDAGARERKGWKGYAVVDAETDYYLYSDFFVNKKDAVKYWKNEMSETKGLIIIELDVYPTLTPLPDKE